MKNDFLYSEVFEWSEDLLDIRLSPHLAGITDEIQKLADQIALIHSRRSCTYDRERKIVVRIR